MDMPTIQLMALLISCVISIVAFIRSGSGKSVAEAKVMGHLEEKLDMALRDLNDIKKQNMEYAKSHTSTEQKLKTLFSWKEDTDERLRELERK